MPECDFACYSKNVLKRIMHKLFNIVFKPGAPPTGSNGNGILKTNCMLLTVKLNSYSEIVLINLETIPK